jgi:predicted lipoprotein with Yx(FWY)xxD motif
MTRSEHVGGRYGRRMAWLLAALVAGFAVAALAALAGAQTPKPPPATVKTAHNSQLSATIVVDSHGMSLYELKPETSHHLLCTSSQCFGFWPPLKTTKKAQLVKGHGVPGKLGRIHRSGFYQVTLDGHPLYHFSADSKKGQANGQGIQSFGGTWHTVKVTTHTSHSSTSTTTPTTSTSTSTSTSSTYSYPSPY